MPPLPSGGPSLRYVALGDSYTIGTSVSEAARWPDQLVARLAADPPVPWKDLDRVLVLGPLGGPVLRITHEERLSKRALLATTGPQPWHGTPEDGAERMDYRLLLDHVKALAGRLEDDKPDATDAERRGFPSPISAPVPGDPMGEPGPAPR